MAKMVLKVEIDLNLDSYRFEYGDDTETLSEIREFMRDSVQGELRLFTGRWPYIESVEVR